MKTGPAALALTSLLVGSTASAYRQPDYLDERPLETADGERGRLLRPATIATPGKQAAAWAAFRAAHGSWRALWDADTGVPTRIYGEGIAAPGAVADPDKAATIAREVLAARVELLAPGASAADFVVTLNAPAGGDPTRRVVVLAQTWRGRRVVDAAVSFLFAHDRLIVIGSTASPLITADEPAQVIDEARATTAALAWIRRVYGGAPAVTGHGEAVVLPIVRDGGGLDHRVVVPVTVDLPAPRALWTVYVDAGTGAPVARAQRLMFAEGTVHYRVPVRHPGGDHEDVPAAFARHTVNSSSVVSTEGGAITWAGGAPALVTPGVTGPYAHVSSASGATATATLAVAPDGTTVWEVASGTDGAQLNAFVRSTFAKTFALATIDPSLGWLSQTMEVVVNEDVLCNAYSNGDDIHFGVAYATMGLRCANTGQLTDVVYHEFGHSLHAQSLQSGAWDSALSEGISDYLAASIVGDPAMGRGFYQTHEPLRHIDPDAFEYRWPETIHPDPHVTGLVIAGALWDLRDALIGDLGEAAGIARADDIFYGVIQRAVDIPSSFVEALATDDDDGNLANGTPNECAIRRAFGAHGLTDVEGGGAIPTPRLDGLDVSVAQVAGADPCGPPAVTGGAITWRLRSDPEVTGEVALAAAGDGFAGAIPPAPDGEVVQYQVAVQTDDGAIATFPHNAVDPWYETYVGPVTPLYCVDFDGAAPPAGWTFDGGFTWGLADAGSRGWDAPTAYSGTMVIGTGLGGSGRYDAETTVEAVGPVIDVGPFTTVRLQYRRWLTIEDGNFDRAQIVVDGAPLWTNAALSTGTGTHLDREWRFHDVDLTPVAGNGAVQVAFRLAANEDTQLGGWNVDELCVVAPGAPVCGDGFASADEGCDDGNDVDGDGCSAACVDETPDDPDDPDPVTPEDPGCCAVAGGGGDPRGAALLALATLAAVWPRRRRAGRVAR